MSISSMSSQSQQDEAEEELVDSIVPEVLEEKSGSEDETLSQGSREAPSTKRPLTHTEKLCQSVKRTRLQQGNLSC